MSLIGDAYDWAKKRLPDPNPLHDPLQVRYGAGAATQPITDISNGLGSLANPTGGNLINQPPNAIDAIHATEKMVAPQAGYFTQAHGTSTYDPTTGGNDYTPGGLENALAPTPAPSPTPTPAPKPQQQPAPGNTMAQGSWGGPTPPTQKFGNPAGSSMNNVSTPWTTAADQGGALGAALGNSAFNTAQQQKGIRPPAAPNAAPGLEASLA